MKKIMTRAWEIYRTLEGDRLAKLAMALRQAWAEAKAEAEKEYRFSIKTWFLNKMIAQCTGHIIPFGSFGKEDIIGETEKAYHVNMEMRTRSLGTESKYTRMFWIPKSCVETYAI